MFMGYNISMKKVWVNKTNSFRKAEDFNIEFWKKSVRLGKGGLEWIKNF